jgi:hypothetical protein
MRLKMEGPSLGKSGWEKRMMSSHKFRSRCVAHATGWMIWTERGVGMLGATSVNWLVSRGYFAEPFSTGEEWWAGRRRGAVDE